MYPPGEEPAGSVFKEMAELESWMAELSVVHIQVDQLICYCLFNQVTKGDIIRRPPPSGDVSRCLSAVFRFFLF